MGKRDIILIVAVLSLLFIISPAEASIKYYEHKMESKYRAGESIRGNFNISIQNEPSNTLIRSNFYGSITLLELLQKNNLLSGIDYKCDTKNCTEDYAVISPISDIDLEKNETVGLKIYGKSIDEIINFEFTSESELPSSCGNPVEIDILNDGENIIYSSTFNDVACSSNDYGCFDKKLSEYSSILIEEDEICETLSLGRAPAYRIGAKIVNSSEGKGRLRMTMYSSNGNSVSCNLPEHTEKEQELDCIVESIPTEGGYNVCIENIDFSSPANSKYLIRSERSGKICGNLGRDFEIFGRPLQFGRMNLTINNSVYEHLYSSSIHDEIFDYILKNYQNDEDGRAVCDPFCIVPIGIRGQSQKIKIRSLDLVFRDDGLAVDDVDYKSLYLLLRKIPKVTSENLKLELEPANFVIPLNVKNKTIFQLFINNALVFKNNISVEESFEFDISPKFALVGLSSKFGVASMFNISSSKWSFGDGSSEETFGGSIRHTYFESGDYRMRVELIRKDGVIAVRTFDILVGDPKESSKRILEIYGLRISNLSTQIQNFPPTTKEELLKVLNLGSMNESVNNLRMLYENSTSEEEYTKIVEELLDLEIPRFIGYSKQGDLPLTIGYDNINVEYIEEISQKEAYDSDDLKSMIIEYMDKYYSSSSSFNVISTYDNEGKNDVLTKFIMIVDPLSEVPEQPSLIIDYPFEGVKFDKDYGQKSVGEGRAIYIPLDDKMNIFEFYIDGGVDLADIGAYVSPPVQSFVFDESNDKPICLPDDKECQEPFPLGRFLIGMLGLLVICIIIYIILQEWYKRHYENHLFKNKQDLYNLVNFIYNSRTTGMHDDEIRKKLKSVGWNGEKINYAFKKIDGKRVGMWEIPLFKSFENKRVREEITKRQGGQFNARFIKRPGF